MFVSGDSYKVILFYRYVAIEDCDGLRNALFDKCAELGLLGRILIASEGINGTLAGSIHGVNSFIEFMKEDVRFHLIDWKDSFGKGDYLPFPQLSVRVVDEIVSSGAKGRQGLADRIAFDAQSFGGLAGGGVHLNAEQFHEALEDDPTCMVLDIRNQFEYDIGRFDKAVNIETYQYAETFDRFDSILPPSSQSQDKKILMYCTGGVRCEKASAYLKNRGYDNVYQLQGGIHRYLEAYPEGGKFKGKNFVFDSRVSVSAATKENKSNESPVDIDAANNEPVGKCIDCNQGFDTYSGFIVCTVCRMPVLVCDLCQRENPHPGEYYCYRHRDLKGVYFTVLNRYAKSELESQKAQLENLINQALDGQKSQRGRGNSANDHNEPSKKPEGVIDQNGRNRRRTLRRQIQRIEDHLKTIANDEKAAQGEIELKDEERINPKVRHGWGFWRS